MGVDLTPGELRQLLNGTVDPIDDSCIALTGGTCGPGWDAHFGYGRINARRAMERLGDPAEGLPPRIPPDVAIRTPAWFETLDPVATPVFDVEATIRARGRGFEWSLAVAAGVEPAETDFREIARRFSEGDVDGPLAPLDLVALFDGEPPNGAVHSPDDPTVTLRLRVSTEDGELGEDRRAFGVHHDPDLLPGFPVDLGSSGEASALMVDLGTGPPGGLDLVVATASGELHAFRPGASGAWEEVGGFPFVLPEPGSSGAPDGGLGSPAYGDLAGDGTGYAIVVPSLAGRIYAVDPRGNLRPGFPVRSAVPSRATPRSYGHANAFVSTPVLADLDLDGDLEIVAGSFDQRLYAFHHDDRDGDGTADPVDGFPVLLRSERGRVPDDRVCIGDDGQPAIEASILGSPVVGILDPVSTDPDLRQHPSIAVATTELCDDDGDGENDTSRFYAVWHDGELHADGPFVPGWPIETPLTVLGAAIPLPPITTGGNFGAAAVRIGDEVRVYGGNFLGFPFLARTHAGTTSVELLLSGDGDLAAGGGAAIGLFGPSTDAPSLVLPTATILNEPPDQAALDHNVVAWSLAPRSSGSPGPRWTTSSSSPIPPSPTCRATGSRS